MMQKIRFTVESENETKGSGYVNDNGKVATIVSTLSWLKDTNSFPTTQAAQSHIEISAILEYGNDVIVRFN